MRNKIKQILKEKDISIYRLNEIMGGTYATTYYLVNRETLNTTSIETLKNVAEALHTDIDDLYEEVDND